METNISGKQNYSSNQSHSSNDEFDYITASHDPNRIERLQDLAFFERRKGLLHGEHSEIELSVSE